MISEALFQRSLRSFFAPVAELLDDPTVSDILINGHDTIYVERGGRLHTTSARFESEDDLYAALRNLAQYVGRHVDHNHPILEARFPDGSRVEAIFPPAAPTGPSVAIRRFQRSAMTVEQLVGSGSISQDAADTLRALVRGKQNIVVAGGTGAGKTSLLNVLSGLVEPTDRIVVIEDARELQLQQPHVVPLEAQPPDPRGDGEVTIRDLFRATLRMRPDRIVVGEIRGGEAMDLLQALTSGHGGGMTTVHANHALDALSRLETMALTSDVQLPLYALRAQVASAVNFIVHVARQADGSRCVDQIAEVIRYEPEGGYVIEELFVREFLGRDDGGRVRSRLVPTGHLPSCHEALRRLGQPLPEALYQVT